MDNEAPNYASWIPEAGGYVANGKVVSKSPMYDEAGKLRLDVDASLFGGTASQPTTTKAQPQVANNPLQNVGITTANTTGSGTDANAMATSVGSLGSLNNNTANTIFGPTNTPATQSNVAGNVVLSPVDQAMQELQQAVARGNDFQAQINAYEKLTRLTGQDYSAEIADLTQKRQQKIENIDNDYASQIATAMMRGDTEEVARLRAEQSGWRNSVGYQDAMTQKYQTAREEIDVDYQTTFWDGIKDIAGMVAQALPGILNFQYDPMQDENLLRAQSLIEMRARNRASQTGMYYSSTTQYAISQACANLIPIYQKMAKEEAIQNFQLLQQTASFLVDLEQAQFNMWKGQLDMKFQANADKRAEIATAWDKVNQLGYVDNETSAILGIPAGTESYATRKAYVDKLNEIDKEKRKLDQDKALAEYENGLAIQRLEKQQELDIEEYNERAKTDYMYDKALENLKTANTIKIQGSKGSNGGNGSGDVTYANAQKNIDTMISGGSSAEEILGYLNSDAIANSLDYSQRQNLLQYATTSINNIVNGLTNMPADLSSFSFNGQGLSTAALRFIDNYYAGDQSDESFGKMLDQIASKGKTYNYDVDGEIMTITDLDIAMGYFLGDLGAELQMGSQGYNANLKTYGNSINNSIDKVKEFTDRIEQSKQLTEKQKSSAKESAWSVLLDSAYDYEEKTTGQKGAGLIVADVGLNLLNPTNVLNPTGAVKRITNAANPTTDLGTAGTQKILTTIKDLEGEKSDVYKDMVGYLDDKKSATQTATTTTTTPINTKTKATPNKPLVKESELTSKAKNAAGQKLKESMSKK